MAKRSSASTSGNDQPAIAPETERAAPSKHDAHLQVLQRLTEWREFAGLSLDEMSERLKELGFRRYCSADYLERMEHDSAPGRMDIMEGYAEVCGCTFPTILSLSPHDPNRELFDRYWRLPRRKQRFICDLLNAATYGTALPDRAIDFLNRLPTPKRKLAFRELGVRRVGKRHYVNWRSAREAQRGAEAEPRERRAGRPQ